MFFAKAGTLSAPKKFLQSSLRAVRNILILIFSLMLYGCASSDVSRDVSSNIDVGVQQTKDMVDVSYGKNIADSYQNMTQRSKLAMLGGAAGAITGYITPVGAFPGLLVGAILGASYGSYIDQYSSIEDQLRNRGSTVVVIGDQILVVMPASRIFETRSGRIKQNAYSSLDILIRYINEYSKMLVKVAVYTDVIGSPDVNLSLSQEQAENISRYLIAGGIDARILYGIGYGGSHLVQRNSSAWDGNDNYRIEVTLEKLYV